MIFKSSADRITIVSKKYVFEGEPERGLHFLGILDFAGMTFCVV